MLCRDCASRRSDHGTIDRVLCHLRREIHLFRALIVSEFEFIIPKEKYEMVRDAMDKSKSVIFVKCDGKKKFLRALADVDN
jgi:hypothetical protein